MSQARMICNRCGFVQIHCTCSKDDEARRSFISRLYTFDAQSQGNLLRIETDDEVAELIRVALEIQHFEMAACLKVELNRRGAEKTVGELDRKNCVIRNVHELRGWHLAECSIYKPGVYRIVISRRGQDAHLIRGFADQQLITTAIELGYLSKPNGLVFP